jgi:BASS family bile acid:Na+ symporter
LDIEEIFSIYGLPALIGLIMFGIGITLQLDDFKRIIVKPKEILTALLGQMIVIPLIAFLIAWFFDFPLWAKMGLILVAACPAGASHNFISYYLKGRLALAVSTTAISSVLVLVTIPPIVNLALNLFKSQEQDITLPAAQTIQQIGLTILLPIVLGLLLKEYKENWADKLTRVMKRIMPVILLIIFGGSLYIEGEGGEIDISKFLNQYPYAILLSIGSMLVSFFLARALLPDKVSHYTISAVVGIQNNALAIFIAHTLLHEPDLAIMPIIYSSFTFFSTALFAFTAKKLST